jgi:hypothetical protein
VSEYGLQAWWAVAALVAVLVVFAGLLMWGGGYPPAASFLDDRHVTTPTASLPRPPAPRSDAPARPVAAGHHCPDSDGGDPLGRAAGRPVAGRDAAVRAPHDHQAQPTAPPPLTRFGEVLLIAERVLGPLLLGLALLAVRGCVKC